MAYPKFHGIKVAANAEIQNAVIEKLTQVQEDALVLTTPGRIWYNLTSKKFKMTTLGDDGLVVIITEISTPESVGITIKDEDVTVASNVQNLNFIGSGVMAVEGTNEVVIYVPEPAWNSYYNSNTGNTNATVADVSTTTRYISNPTGTVNGGFSIGDWTAGTTHSVVHTNTLTYATAGLCLFDNNLTTDFEVNVYDADGTTKIATLKKSDITGNSVTTDQGITITISGFVKHYHKYTASISVSIDLNNLGAAGTSLDSGGRFSVEMIHYNVSGNYTKTQSNLFYEPTTTTDPVLTGVSISEGTVTGKYLSGIKYYINNDSFTLAISDVDNLNRITYPQPFVNVSSNSIFGIPDFDISSATSGLTGWTSAWDNQNVSFSASKVINRSSFRYIGAAGNISARWVDWSTGSYVSSTNQSVCIDTYTSSSTDINEDFRDEVKRLTSSWEAWNSQTTLSTTDLMIQSDVLKRQTGNWTTYRPGLTNNGDYSAANTNTQYYYRGFRHANTSHTNGKFNLSGVTQANLDNEDIVIWISLDGTSWFKCNDEYLGGTLSNGAGCRINVDSMPLPTLEFTLGSGLATSASTGPSVNSYWGIYCKIEMKNGSSVQLDTIRITNWS